LINIIFADDLDGQNSVSSEHMGPIYFFGLLIVSLHRRSGAVMIILVYLPSNNMSMTRAAIFTVSMAIPAI
jgi:hypothetical protein